MTLKTSVLTILSIFFLGLAVGYFVFSSKGCQDQYIITSQDSIGVYTKINDSLSSYLASVSHKFDSILVSNLDLFRELKKAKETPEVITIVKTETIIREVKVSTYADTLPDTRIAFYNDKWLKFRSTYRTKEPFDFTINDISIPSPMALIQSKTEDGRIKVYVKTYNPYVKTGSLETYVNPTVLLNNRIPQKPWSLIVSGLYNPGTQRVGIATGVYIPQGVGIVGGINNLVDAPDKNYYIGLSFKKDF